MTEQHAQALLDEISLTRDEIRAARKDLDEIRLAVTGDSKLGIDGIPKRIKRLETWRNTINLRVAYTAGAVSAISFTGLEGLKKVLGLLIHKP